MLNKNRPALKSCSQKPSESSSSEVIDWLNKLPDDILIHILSSLTLKEAARTSILSHRWKDLWRYRHTLNFEDPIALERLHKPCSRKIRREERQKRKREERMHFIMWVDDVLNNHLGSVVDEFRIDFDLNKECCESHIGKWLDFAFKKQVKTLDMDFTLRGTNVGQCPLPLECLPYNLATINNNSLTTLRLHDIDITAEALEHILNSLPSIEHLCISTSNILTSLRISGMSSKLKYLKVFDCLRLEVLNISTPKLLSFEHDGYLINLSVENASSLSKFVVGARHSVPVEPSFHSLSKYFPQLELLHFRFFLCKELNLGIKEVPALPNLKHLKLELWGNANQSILGWIPLIEASPLLQNLTLKFMVYEFISPGPIPKRDGKPLRCLKTLEILGFVGCMIDLEVATYVLENACGLEQVTVSCKIDDNDGAQGRAEQLRRKLPQGASFILTESALWYRYLLT